MVFSGDTFVPRRHVSPQADAEFMRYLENEDPKRYAALLTAAMRAKRKDAPVPAEGTNIMPRTDAPRNLPKTN